MGLQFRSVILVTLFALPIDSNAELDKSRVRAAEVIRRDGFEIRQTDQGVRISENDQPVLHYQRLPKQVPGDRTFRRAHYVHPVYDLRGKVMTEDFPHDHLHHRGIFWAWHQVVVNGRQAGDAWLCQDFDWDVQRVDFAVRDRIATVVAESIWTSTDITDDVGRPIPIARDLVEIRVPPRQANSRTIEFTIRLSSLVDDLKIGGSDDAKGYGGFSARMRMPPDLSFHSESGVLTPTRKAVQAANWVEFRARDLRYSIVASESNPGDRDRWILRQSSSMQNPLYPGRNLVPISKDQPTVLKYQLVISK